ncbi:MAG: prolyl oligopeptidase family serine peptidase [Cytophagales bacterium]|nr:prolyl oligopeptidase family serine peptidase [Cytophagales bacterium]
MRTNKLLLCSAAIILMSSCAVKDKKQVEASLSLNELTYPVTEKSDQIDTLHGVVVADPYRWLEDDRSTETEAWVIAQNKVTNGYLEQLPYREEIKKRMTEIWNYPRYTAPFKAGDKYYFYKNDGLQNQKVLYQQETLEGEATLFLDPNKFSEDGTVAMGRSSFSKDGKFFAYSISRSGSDWKEIYVMDVESKKLLKDKIEWVKFSGISWEGKGFYYSRYDAPVKGKEYSNKNEFHKVFYHRIGDSQSKDKLVYEDKEHAQRNFYAYTTEDEDYLVLSGSEGTSGNTLMVRPRGKKKFVTLVNDFEKDHYVVNVVNDKILIYTNLDAPNNRLVAVDLKNPTPENWKDVIPNQDRVLKTVSVIGGKIIIKYLEDATSKVYLCDLSGKLLEEVKLPGIGTANGFWGKKEDKEVFYGFTSFTFPSNIYKFDVINNKSELYKKSEINFDIDNYVTKQVFYTSKDGTKVPMFIVHKKGLKLDGSNPTYLYGYGGFNISLQPRFSKSTLIWLENGGVYAQPNLRGGGEYGKTWHEAGMKLNKQNVFDDFIAAAEYLIDQNYTRKDRLAIAGGSNGGLLVGACITQRPDLYQVAFPAVGVMDMLRYHKFTIGWAWAVEFGSSEDEEQFHYLYKYSPLHNLKKTEYPATMILTADHDDRVVPAHSFKFAAALQEHQQGNNPALIRIETKAGHGAGKPTSKVIQERADIFAFAWYNMRYEPTFEKKLVP